MATVPAGKPEGRYGRSADERADRKLKIIGGVLGTALLGVVVWSGYSYITGQDVSGRLIGFQVVSDDVVKVHLEVRKGKDDTGVCTLRSRAEDGTEVGRRDVTFDQRTEQVDEIVTIHTTERGTNAELVGCKNTSDG
ncbi:DUF4307 domain-containing protein [Streptomyces sp. SAJ15]|uniref:DUF4307 domain-containing protein n=1 Tax=Streptomyces sp. SAJ15 TaxID=2011095 RepID=UPI0011856274|nr:DUF4307 domain-containing protein [Streptomyces sp. SAJ15]TVL93881.1 hypothetical protein CD790_02280 [Streptomyces sp. SAJ15]